MSQGSSSILDLASGCSLQFERKCTWAEGVADTYRDGLKTGAVGRHLWRESGSRVPHPSVFFSVRIFSCTCKMMSAPLWHHRGKAEANYSLKAAESRTFRAIRQPSSAVGMLVLPPVISGISDASATNKFARP